jgi:hypothetical protein
MILRLEWSSDRIPVCQGTADTIYSREFGYKFLLFRLLDRSKLYLGIMGDLLVTCRVIRQQQQWRVLNSGNQ